MNNQCELLLLKMVATVDYEYGSLKLLKGLLQRKTSGVIIMSDHILSRHQFAAQSCLGLKKYEKETETF